MNNRINVHFLNVGAGDSIVIEFCLESAHYVVIDSNLVDANSQKVNPAYEFLKTRDVSTISTLIITHLHQDHYNGIEHLLNNFDIKKIVIPPFLSLRSAQYNKILDKYKENIREYIERCADDDTFQYGKSLTYLLHFLTNNDDKVEEVSGKESILRFPGVSGEFYGRVYLPLKRITGVLHHLIEQNDYALNHFPTMNDSSVAFCLSCYGHDILLTGDSTASQWNEHKRQMGWDGITNLGINLLKVPHHGSKYDNTEKLYTYFFRKDGSKYAFTSADGIQHPDKELFDLIKTFKLRPYCTNISQPCLPPNVLKYKPMAEFPKQMKTFLSNYVEAPPIPCQGNIHLSIDNEGDISVTNSTGMPCVYRDIEDDESSLKT